MRKTKFIVLLTIGSLLTFGLSGCKDYDSEIDDLNKKIGEVEAKIATSVDALKTTLESWVNGKGYLTKAVTNISRDGNDLVVTASDGSTATYRVADAALASQLWEWKTDDAGVKTLWINGAATGLPYPAASSEKGANGNLWIDGKDTGLPFPSEGVAEEPFEWKDGTLWIGGKNTEVPVPSTEKPWEKGTNGNLFINGEDTGLPYPSGVPTPSYDFPPGVLVAVINGAKVDFYTVDADGKKPATPTFSIPLTGGGGSGGGGGITSITFVPEFTLDGKPAIYATAISVDTANGWHSFSNATDTIYGDLVLKFRVNGTAADITSVELVPATLFELRATSNDGVRPANNVIPAKGTNEYGWSVSNNILSIAIPQQTKDSLFTQLAADGSISGSAAGDVSDYQPFLAVAVNGGVISSYIPFVTEVIQSDAIYIGEKRANGYSVYGISNSDFGSATREERAKHVTVLDVNTFEANLEPVLIYRKGGDKSLPLRGFDKVEYDFLLRPSVQGQRVYNLDGSTGKETFDDGEAYFAKYDVKTAKINVLNTDGRRDSVFSLGLDTVRVKIRMNLHKYAEVLAVGGKGYYNRRGGADNSALYETLRDSTDNSTRSTRTAADDMQYNALIKVSGVKYFDGTLEAPVIYAEWYRCSDSIVDNHATDGGILAATTCLLDTNKLRDATSVDWVGDTDGSGNFGIDLSTAVTTVTKDMVKYTKGDIGFFEVQGATATGNIEAHLIAKSSVDKGTYDINWSIELPAVKDVQFEGNYRVTLVNPSIEVTKAANAGWAANTLVSYGDTIFNNPINVSGILGNRWDMAAHLYQALDTTLTKARFVYPAGKVHATPFDDTDLDSDGAATATLPWTFKLVGTTHDKVVEVAGDSIYRFKANGTNTWVAKAADATKYVDGSEPVELQISVKDGFTSRVGSHSYKGFPVYFAGDVTNAGKFNVTFKNPLAIKQEKLIEIDNDANPTVPQALKDALLVDYVTIKSTAPGREQTIKYGSNYDENDLRRYFAGSGGFTFGISSGGKIDFYGAAGAPTLDWATGTLPEGSTTANGYYNTRPTLTTHWGQVMEVSSDLTPTKTGVRIAITPIP